MKRLHVIIFLLLSFIFFSCSSAQVNRIYNQSFDFTPFTTYKIIKELPKRPDGVQMPSATYGLIKSAVDLEMAKKSFGKNKERAEFGITWHTALNDKVFENDEALKDWEKNFNSSEEGMLIIDIVYLETGNVVWRGWEKSVLGTENLEERINEAVQEILEPFPPTSVPTGNN